MWEGLASPRSLTIRRIRRRRQPRDFGQTNSISAPGPIDETRDFGQTNPISRPEAERRIARFSPNEPNFPAAGRTMNRVILAERTQSPRYVRTAQMAVRIGFGSKIILRAAAPNEPNPGCSGAVRRSRLAMRGARGEPRPPGKVVGPPPPGTPISRSASGPTPRERRADRETGASRGLSDEAQSRRIRPNEPNFRAARERRNFLEFRDLRPEDPFLGPRRTNPIGDRSEAGRPDGLASAVSAGRSASQAIRSRRTCSRAPGRALLRSPRG